MLKCDSRAWNNRSRREYIKILLCLITVQRVTASLGKDWQFFSFSFFLKTLIPSKNIKWLDLGSRVYTISFVFPFFYCVLSLSPSLFLSLSVSPCLSKFVRALKQLSSASEKEVARGGGQLRERERERERNRKREEQRGRDKEVWCSH